MVIPSPAELSDSEDDGVSPSQHKLAMKKLMAKHDITPNSDEGSDEGMFRQVIRASKITHFCNSGEMGIIGSTCSNEIRIRKTS